MTPFERAAFWLSVAAVGGFALGEIAGAAINAWVRS